MVDNLKNVKSLDAIRSMDYDEARRYLSDIKNRYAVTALTRHWDSLAHSENIYNSKVYNLFKEYDVPVNTARMAKAHEVKTRMAETRKQIYQSTATAEPLIEQPVQAAAQETAIKEEPKQANKKKAAFTINLEGEFEGNELTKKLNGICQLMIKDKTYNIKFLVEEAGE